MPSSAAIWALIAGMTLVNFAERFVPLLLVAKLSLPKAVERWLSYVPIAVMGSLFATEVLMPPGAPTNPFAGSWLYAGLITAITYRFTRSFLGSSLAGMASFVAIRALLG